MKISLKHAASDSLVHAVVRMNRSEYRALRVYMHTKEGKNIGFPYGTEIIKRGRGWYQLVATNEKRGVDKISFALRVINQFLREEEARVEEEIKRLAPLMRDLDLRLASFSNTHSAAGFGYLSQPSQPLLASADQLNKLAAKFNHTHKAA